MMSMNHTANTFKKKVNVLFTFFVYFIKRA